MVKLKYTKRQGVSSQMGLLRFAEEMSKGIKITPEFLLVGSFIFALIIFFLGTFTQL